MPTLPEIQTAFAAALLGGETEAMTAAVVADHPGARERLGIYQNHFTLTLIEALNATFPVIRRLVGDDFFAAAARAFVLETPPAGPCLFEYGREFPDHIAALPASAPLVYLRDVGRLEWAINVAYHAPDGQFIEAPALESMSPQRVLDTGFAFHPSCRLISSCFPIDRIWQVNQTEADDVEPVDLRTGGVRLLVHRQGGEVGWLKFSRGEFAFLRTLSFGGSFGDAADVARRLGGEIDVANLLTACLEGGLFSTLSRVS
jgi:hypothetical protein